MKTTNPDVPKKKHREVKAYASRNGLKIPEGYDKILEKALKVPDKALEIAEQHAEDNNTSVSKSMEKIMKKGYNEVKK